MRENHENKIKCKKLCVFQSLISVRAKMKNLLKFLLFLIALFFSRISAETTDRTFLTSTDFSLDYSDAVEISNTTLKCWKFASTSDHEVMCKMDKNITGDNIVQITSVKTIPQNKLKEVKSVTMSRQNVIIEKIPQKLGNHFMNLEKLIAMNVGMKTVRRTDFSDLSKLKVLNLGDNKLVNVPYDAFYELKDLEVIFLDRNKIRSLNVAIFTQSTSLRIVFLNFNQLKRLDDVFVRNFRIQEIYLNNNFLENILIDFKRLPELKIVDLRRNSEICMKCESHKKVKNESYNICDYEKALKVKIYQECFQDCALEKIKSLNGSKPILDECAKSLKNAQKLNNEHFQNHTKCDDKSKIPNLIKQLDRLIYIKLHNDSFIREKFDSCISAEIFKDLEVDNLMKNCSDTKRLESEKVEDFYTKCTFCRPSKIENQMKKCKVRFEKSTAQAMDDFQASVRELFRN